MFLLYCSLILGVIAFVQPSPVTNTHGDVFKSERELRRDIFRDYDRYVRPVKRPTTAVPLKFDIMPISLRSMNEKDQLISLESFMRMTWTDEYLQWDPSEYENITYLTLPLSEVWRPDIALYTASPDTSLFPTVHTDIILYNTGVIMWVPPFTINSRCPIPFGNHVTSARTFVECNIKFGSWTQSGKRIDLQLYKDKVDLTDFQDFNREWKLVKVVSNRESRFYPCCTEEYPSVNFNVTLKRRNFNLNSGIDN